MSASAPDGFSYPAGITFLQANEGPTLTEPTIDLRDSATVAWSLVDDPASGRLEVQATAQGLEAGLTGLSSANAGVYVDDLGHVWTVGAGGTGAFSTLFPGDAEARLQIRTDGEILLGDGVDPADVELSRAGIGVLAITQPGAGVGAALQVGRVYADGPAGAVAFIASVTGEAVPRVVVLADGIARFSDGANPSDVQLARAGTGTMAITRPSDGVGALQLGVGAGANGYLYNNGGAGLRIGHLGTLGFFSAAPIAQPVQIFQTAGFVQGSGTTVLSGSTFTGGIGANPYSIGDIVRCLKLLGLVAS